MNLRIRFFLTASLIPSATILCNGQFGLAQAPNAQGGPAVAPPAKTTRAPARSAVQKELDKLYRGKNTTAPAPLPIAAPQATISASQAAAASNRTGKAINTPQFLNVANESATATAKTVVTAPVQVAQPAAPPVAYGNGLPGPAPVLQQGNGIQRAANTQQQAAGVPNQTYVQKSEIQKQLEAMYAKDGRQMPPMSLNELPQQGPSAPPLPTPPAGAVQNAAATAPKAGLLQRLFGGKKAPPPMSAAPRPGAVYPQAMPVVPQNVGVPANRMPVAPYQQRPPAAVAQPARLPVATQLQPQYSLPVQTQLQPQIQVQPQIQTQVPAPVVNAPQFVPPQVVVESVSTGPQAKPVPVPIPVSQIPVSQTRTAANPVAAPAEQELPRLDTGDAEPEVTEQPVAAEPAAPVESESPFSGLKLQTPEEPDPQALKSVPETAEERLTVPAETPSLDEEDKDKLNTLAAVKDRKGFKGFCPVALKNQRELVPTKAEFESEYNGRKYQFGSPDAKAEFEKDPRNFVPAGDGQDLVMLIEEDQKVEGVLDFAAWYQGKLYLFASQQNLEVFTSSPEEFTEEEFNKISKPTLKADDDSIPELKDVQDDDEEEFEAPKAGLKAAPKAPAPITGQPLAAPLPQPAAQMKPAPNAVLKAPVGPSLKAPAPVTRNPNK